MKKNNLILLLLFFIFFSSNNNIFSSPTYSQFGAGIILGEPWGLTGKYWLDGKTAIDFALGSTNGTKTLQIHGDYLFHDFSLIKVEKVDIPLYFGGGLLFRLGNESENKFAANNSDNGDFQIALRPLVGIGIIFAQKKLEGFLEISPLVLEIIPNIGLGWSIALGIRYYF